MKVCDRHPRTAAVDSIKMAVTDCTYDLCQACSELLLTFLGDIEQETVEPPKKPRKSKKT